MASKKPKTKKPAPAHTPAVVAKTIEHWPIKELKPHPHNAKTHPPEQVAHLARLIERHGFDQPVVITRHGEIVKGHGRVLAATHLGWDTVPVIVTTQTPGRVRENRLADNRYAETDWDLEKLRADVTAGKDEPDFDIEDAGFTLKDLGLDDEVTIPGDDDEDRDNEEPLLLSDVIEPETPEPPKEAITKTGDVWKLGVHTLVCSDVDAYRPPAGVALALHDPPYGISIVQAGLADGKKHGKAVAPRSKFTPVEGDNKPFDPTRLLSQQARVIVLWGANHYAQKLPPSASWIVWDKRVDMPSNFFSDAELAWVSKGGSVRIIRHRWQGMIRDSERGEARVHPTQKPVVVHASIIETYTKKGELVFDGYAGSGTTLLACEQLGRVCHTVEIEPKYCDVIVSRWEALTGNKAKLIR